VTVATTGAEAATSAAPTLSAAVVASSPLSPRRFAEVTAAALDAWPFLRPIAAHPPLANVLLVPPETAGTGLDGIALERAFTQNEAVYDALPAWSAAHPDAAFALVEVESLGGRCRYGGYVCRDGAIHAFVLAAPDADRGLLAAVGLDLGTSLDAFLLEHLRRP